MTYYISKLVLSAAIIVAVSEISKRSTWAGGLLASLPLVSLLGLFWLYRETQDAEKVASLSTSIFWLVLPSLIFFLVFPALLRARHGFYPSLTISILAMLAAYGVMLSVLKRFGVNL